MEEHKYTVFKGRWGISISIYGQIFDKNLFEENAIEVCNGIWLSFSECPLVDKEIFCEEDKEAIINAINMVKECILSNSMFSDRTVIQICSLQYSACYYQKEAMTVAMLNWCSKVFGFEHQEVKCSFDKEKNKYIFGL